MILRRPVCRVRLATALPFVLGVFIGTMLTAFLVLAVRSIDDLGTASERAPHESQGFEDWVLAPTLTEDKKSTTRIKIPKATVSYNILSSKEYLQSRVLSIHRTWGSNTDVIGDIEYYLYPPGGDIEINFAMKRRLPVVSLGVQSTYEIYSKDRIDYQGVFRVWRDICERKLDQYKWFVKLQDNVYIKPKEFEKLLSSLNSSEPLLIGQSVFPTGEDRDHLGLKEGENYCLESGYAASWGVMERVCPMLGSCQENAKSENEDVEVARCIRKYAKINCTAATEMRELFYKADDVFAEEELQIGEHRLNPSIKKALILTPLNEPDHFYHLHQYYTELELKGAKLSAKQLRLHMIQTAELGAKTDSILHMSDTHSPLWTRMGVNPPHLPANENEVVHFQSFDYQYKYTESMHYPLHPLSGVEHKDIRRIVDAATSSLAHDNSTSFGSKNRFTVESVMQRTDPQRGIDYFLQVVAEDANGKHQSMILHSLREAEPPHVISLHGASYKTTKVNFVVEAPPVSRGFQRFMMSFESSFLARNPPELVGLLVILYSSDGMFKRYDQDLYSVTTLLNLYKNKYPQADLRFVSTSKAHSRKDSFTIASKEFHTYELLFLADIHIDFSMQFLERCRMNAIENKQVFFPAVFNPYDPDEFYKSRILYPHATKFQTSSDKGNWMHESYHIACVYNYDLLEALRTEPADQNQDNMSLLDLFIQFGELKIFRSVEPGLVHLWQDGCKEEDLGKTEKSLCEKLDSILNSALA